MFEPVAMNTIVCGGENLLIQGDACAAIPEWNGRIQAVYCDPPFLTGKIFTRRRRFGEEGWRSGKPKIELPCYKDRFTDLADYMRLLRGIAENARALLTDTGLFMLHLDWRASARGRIICDEVFGEDCFVNEVIWAYESGGRAKRTFCRKHDTILIYGKTRDWRMEPMAAGIRRDSRPRSHMKRGVDEKGRAYSEMISGGKAYRYYDDDLVTPGDVWTDISHLQQLDPERTGWPTQKPAALLRRLLVCALRPGDTVAELCCGAGTACVVARELCCGYVGVDLSPMALTTAALRMRLNGLTLRMPLTPDGAELQGSLEGDSVVLISGFHTGDDRFPVTNGPLDEAEAWLPGRLQDGVFTATEVFQRTVRQPALTPMGLIPDGPGYPAVVCIDAAGQAHGFRWRM